ncbi:hypothetical protein CHH77_15830 [Shouchella clausii]|uniref:ribonuclease E inhibitor RraB n=1 Tax=Shouchella clausii TaxID=79880 RepID=UPI000BA7DFFC|nr:ribonuclease E inhibitor RraB [Shouchella clausii]PAE80748.1 hypothetical protein CHH77_15830 [Shouchella clausii]
MARFEAKMNYSTFVEKETDVIYGTIQVRLAREEWDVPYYIVSDDVFAHERREFDGRSELQEILDMISFFYNETDAELESVVILKPFSEAIAATESFSDWLEEWQRYFHLSGLKDVGYIHDVARPDADAIAQILEDHGFEKELMSEDENRAFYFYSTALPVPVDFPNDEEGIVLQQLKNAGCDLEKPREVEFILLIENKRMAKKAARLVSQHGFETSLHEEEQGYALSCTLEMVLTYKAVKAKLKELEDLTTEFGAVLDGWSAMTDEVEQ